MCDRGEKKQKRKKQREDRVTGRSVGESSNGYTEDGSANNRSTVMVVQELSEQDEQKEQDQQFHQGGKQMPYFGTKEEIIFNSTTGHTSSMLSKTNRLSVIMSEKEASSLSQKTLP